MSKVSLLNISIVVIGLVISFVILGMAYNDVDNVTEADTINTTVPIEERSGFMLKIYDDKIGVFRTPSETPYSYLDTDISYLNEYDRELLSNGIEVTTEEELKSLIEDLTS
ncbi:MAG: hypothetical protein ACI4WH_02200 [Oscillospiraceae bacterium]